MPSVKKEGVTFRVSPAIKATLGQAAERGSRNRTSMRETMIQDWSAAHQAVSGP